MPATRARSQVPLRLGIEPPDRIVAAARSRGVVLPDVYYGQMRGLARQLSFSIAGVSSLDQLQLVKDSLDRAMETGEGFRDWRRRVLRGEIPLSLPDHRLETIFRTNIQGNYARGGGEWHRRNLGTHPFLMYDAVNDSRTRPAHRAMDGTIRPAADPWWRTHHPINGYNCRCRAIPLTQSQAKRQGGVTENPPTGPESEPDPGFAYDPRADPKTGLFEAIRRQRRRIAPQLVPASQALETALAAPLRVDTVDGALDLGRTRLAAILADVDALPDAGVFTPTARAAAVIDRVRDAVRAEHGAHAGSQAFTNREARAWSAWYPKSWIQAADAWAPLLKIRKVRGRARYMRGVQRADGTWIAPPNLTFSSASVFVHELGHHLQKAMPALDTLFQDWVRRRIGPTPGAAQRLAALFPRHGYRMTEVAFPDGFWHPYVGKDYGRGRGFLEAAAMLPQAILADPHYLADILARDRETAEFALGILLGWRP